MAYFDLVEALLSIHFHLATFSEPQVVVSSNFDLVAVFLWQRLVIHYGALFHQKLGAFPLQTPSHPASPFSAQKGWKNPKRNKRTKTFELILKSFRSNFKKKKKIFSPPLQKRDKKFWFRLSQKQKFISIKKVGIRN